MSGMLYDEAIDPHLFGALEACLVHADLDAFNRCSYWYPLGREPRLLIEAAITQLAPLMPSLDGILGVEWWAEGIAPGRGLRWHFDLDHDLLKRTGRTSYPVWGSILYFDAHGGPTVILDQIAGEPLAPPEPTRALAFAPRRNRFGIFGGELRHGIAATGEPPDSARRLTVPLNWWHHKPEPPTCIDPPYGDAEFAPLTNACEWAPPAPRVAEPIELAGERLYETVLPDRPRWPRC